MGLAVVIAIANAGCSIATDVCIVNQTNEILRIRYRVDPTVSLSENTAGRRMAEPQVLSLQEFQSRDRRWREVASGTLRFDESSRVVEVSLESQCALRLTRAVNGFDADDLPITELELVGSRGAIRLDGLQARLQFVITDSTYQLTYR